MMNPFRFDLSKLWKFSESDHSQILQQKYLNLDATFQKHKLKSKDTNKEFLFEKIEQLFESPKSWDNINLVEQYMIELFEEDTLEMELQLKLIKSKERLPSESYNFYKTSVENKSVKDRRHLLSKLTKDLQFSFDYEDLIRDYSRLIRIRTNILVVMSLVVFFMVDQFPQFAKWLLDVEKGDTGDAIVTSMAAGGIGASFSILIGLKKRISSSTMEDLRIMHRLEYIFSRLFIGLVAGLVLFYFFQSGILAGDFFPKIKDIDLQTVGDKNALIMDSKNHSLLVVWCFIAGFFEKLVPDILAKTGKKATS